MKIDTFNVGRFEIRNTEEGIEYLIDGVHVQLVELPSDSIERITLEVLLEMYDRENADSGLSWED